MEHKLKDQTALITGAGSGVGRAMAKLFAENGCNVVVVDVVPERVKQVVEEIGNNASGRVHDLSTKSEVERMIDETLNSRGKIDILCKMPE